MKPIFLIGFMGSGKSTVGKALQNILDWDFVDTDALFEAEEKFNISDYFARFGEIRFRKEEHMYLKRSTQDNTIVSTGGGIVLRLDNVIWMQSHGTIVYLATSFEQIVKRLYGDMSRPLFQAEDMQATYKRFTSRLPLYESAANYVVQTDGLSPVEIADQLVVQLKL